MSEPTGMRRVGIVGYGHLGQYLVAKIQTEGQSLGFEISFVWNRSSEKLTGKIPEELVLTELGDFHQRKSDLIVEVAHPQIAKDYGTAFLTHSDFMIGSPTALADPALETRLRDAAKHHGNTLYVPSGAFWGGEDIQKMAAAGTLKALRVTMSKHPSCFRLSTPLPPLGSGSGSRTVLFSGSVRDLCSIAPNNVNSMAAAAMAAHNLGFSGVTGCIVSDTDLTDWHVVLVEVTGPEFEGSGRSFTVKTERRNPAKLGAVTGNATYQSFWSSILVCKGHGGVVHLC
ncbi:putative L-aspartate dehydrogenase isoform X2 [Polyodon spathula]|uniref:putative L-aspartate dehydrogenase isoform X2 n=1 Tax=Polyodon spathula TaxID=7913 RepID=UPI001B7E44A8|nr:putative L-aspartate dehydrogenase isoform X2 [Polyodon spathula]